MPQILDNKAYRSMSAHLNMVFDMGRAKARVQVNIPKELLDEARKEGLNLSKVLENALRERLVKLKGE